jgi:hypothetical protein
MSEHDLMQRKYEDIIAKTYYDFPELGHKVKSLLPNVLLINRAYMARVFMAIDYYNYWYSNPKEVGKYTWQGLKVIVTMDVEEFSFARMED